MAERTTTTDAGRASNRRGETVDTQGYWRANVRLIATLLVIWFAVSYVPVFFVNQLNQLVIAGFPIGYYFGSQGSLIVFVILIFYYAYRMARLDREYGLDDD
jgi:putative solute:sodium symporter small subunit